MAKRLECQCGFAAGGPHSTVEELQDVAVAHVRSTHPDMFQQHGEAGIRQMTPALVKEG